MPRAVRAAVAQGDGSPLVIDEVELRDPEPDELLVELRATGLCHTDLSSAHGQFPAPRPGILGHEGAGVVVEIGSDVTGIAPGDHVVLHNAPRCGRCGPCRSGRTGFCEDLIAMSRQPPAFTWRGEPLGSMSRAASFATHTVIPSRQVTVMPSDVPFASAALIPCGVMTGFGAVNVVAGVRPGDTVVVVGLGSIGLNAVQSAVMAGAGRVVAIDTNAGKEPVARAFGATDFVDPSTVDGPLAKHIRRIVGGWPDHAFECVGIASLLPTVLSLVHPYYGVCVAVGLPPQDQVFSLPVSAFATGRSLLGTFVGDGDPNRDVPLVLEAYRDGRFKLDELVTEERAFEDLPAALERLSTSTGIRTVVTHPVGER
jgi:S-(hydroxymethyl)glutathione dehydrogenase/alcohol dehydrogenase